MTEVEDHRVRFSLACGLALTMLLVPVFAGSEPKRPDDACRRFVSPFAGGDRSSFTALKARIVSQFGAHRTSYLKGHKHSGIDLEGGDRQAVFAMCPGTVIDVHLGFPHRTVVIEHRMTSGETVYTSYKHVEGIRVSEGDRVTPDTQLARLFSRAERKRARFKVNHLHLEVRHSFEDGGEASWSSMSRAELTRYFHDPAQWLRGRMDGRDDDRQ